MEKRMRRKAAALLAGLFLCLLVTGVLFWEGILWFNSPSRQAYPVRGVDVSSCQGAVDWETVASQGTSLAFLKATEGSGYQDARFAENWENARGAGLKTGAYHFFSYDSPGEAQAEHFISTVPRLADALPPAVDIEFYGGNEKNPPSREKARAILRPLLARLEAHYGKKPILYATGKSYELYLRDDFEDYPVWIRNVLTRPALPDKREWTFWQYSHRGRLKGVAGTGERFTDLNVFRGTVREFEQFALGPEEMRAD